MGNDDVLDFLRERESFLTIFCLSLHGSELLDFAPLSSQADLIIFATLRPK